MPITEVAKSPSPDYYQRYKNLKRKLKILIYENESFREELKRAQKKLLKVTRDKSFLLDRLLQYEAVDSSTSDSEETMSSDSEVDMKELQTIKRKKLSTDGSDSAVGTSNSGTNSGEAALKKKKPARKTQPIKTEPQQTIQPPALLDPLSISHGDGHMTSEEIERHLEAKQPLRDLLPEKAPLTVPAELFSNEPSGLDSEVADVHGDSSPSNIAEGVNEDGLLIDLPE